MWKKSTCDLLFVWMRKALKCGRTPKVPWGAAGEGQGCGAAQQKWLWCQNTHWLRLPRSHSLSLQGRASWCDGSCCWDCLTSTELHKHQCCPDCWGSAGMERRKKRNEDDVRWDYNQELLSEIGAWEYHGENAVSWLCKVDQTGIIRTSLSNSLDIPLSHSRMCLICSPLKLCREFWSFLSP